VDNESSELSFYNTRISRIHWAKQIGYMQLEESRRAAAVRSVIDFVITSKVVARRYEVHRAILTAIYHITAAVVINLPSLSVACFLCWTSADSGTALAATAAAARP